MAIFSRKSSHEPRPPEQVKRGRGRPRKNPVPEAAIPTNEPAFQPRPARIGGFKFWRNQKLLYIAFVVALAAIPTIYFYSQNKNSQKKLAELKGNSQQTADKTSALIEQVSKLVLLPTDEQPTVASVSDPQKLKGQVFFANAQTGDKVLVYNNAQRAILYRPSINKIIEMAPLNSSTTDPASPQ